MAPQRLTDEQIASFLADQQTGVLSLAADDDGYGVPMSFVYDEADTDIYLRFGYGSDSEKREYVRSSDRVSFVVYDDTDEGWKSVVARGPIEELSTVEDLRISHPRGRSRESVQHLLADLRIPFFRVFDLEDESLEFVVGRIDVAELTGIRTTS